MLRLLIGAVLIAVLLHKIDLNSLGRALISIPPQYWLACVGLILIGVVISCFKLQILLSAFGVKIPLIQVFRIYMISAFWNNFLPGAVGGDIVKFGSIQKYSGHRMDVAVSIFAERFSGMVLLLIIAAATSMINRGLFSSLAIPGGVMILAAGAAGFSIALRWFLPLVLRREPPDNKGWLQRIIRKSGLSGRALILNNRAIWVAVVTSLIFVIDCILAFQVLVAGLGFDIPFTQISAASCLIILVTWLPISFNGLGIREWGCVYFFGLCGIPSEKAMAISLLMYLATLTVSLLGGIIYMFDSRSSPEASANRAAPPAQ